MTLSTLVLETNAKALREYWSAREALTGTREEGNIFDNVLIATVSARLSPEEWTAVLNIAGKRFTETSIKIEEEKRQSVKQRRSDKV